MEISLNTKTRMRSHKRGHGHSVPFSKGLFRHLGFTFLIAPDIYIYNIYIELAGVFFSSQRPESLYFHLDLKIDLPIIFRQCIKVLANLRRKKKEK